MNEPRFAPLKYPAPGENPIEFILRDIEQRVAEKGWDGPIAMFALDLRPPIGLQVTETNLGRLGGADPVALLDAMRERHLTVEPYPQDDGGLYALVISYEGWTVDGCESRIVSTCTLYGQQASLVRIHDRRGGKPDEVSFLVGEDASITPRVGRSVVAALRALMAAIHDHPNGAPRDHLN